jgi:bla regulator protein BlaR1
MSWLLIIGLKNAIFVMPLALLAFGIGRYSKRPALAHVLWLVVLVKLLTPPLVDVPIVPVGWLDVDSLISSAEPVPAPVAPAMQLAAVRQTGDLDTACEPAPAATVRSEVGSQPVAITCPTDKPATGASLPPVATQPAMTWLRSPALWIGLAGAGWLIGSLIVAVLLATRAWRFHRFVRLAARVDDRLAGRVAELARIVGLGRGPRVVVVEGVVSPMLWGVGRGTRLIFPAQLAARLDGAEIDSLLLHELAHFARGDHWVRLLELAAHVLYWWHPVVWFARREIEAAEEQCCDAWVVKHQHGSRRSYAEALLTTIDFLCEPQEALPPAACGLGEVPLLRIRLTQIMKGQLAAGMSRGVQALVLSAGVVISPLQPASWATSSPESAQIERILPARPATTGNITPTVATPSSSAESSSSDSAPEVTEVSPEPSPMAVSPASAPPSPLRWSALSPNGNYRLEHRRDRTTLVHERDLRRIDLSAYGIKCAAFAPDSRSFVTGQQDGTIRWWDSETGGLFNTFGDKSGPVTSVAFGPNKQVAAGWAVGAVSIYDLDLGTENRLNSLPAVACVRWSPDGQRLAVGLGYYQDSQGSVLIWDPSSSDQPEEFMLPQPVGALSWLSDSSLVIADWSGQALKFDAATGELTPGVTVEKTLVSAANWSPDCPLVTSWQRLDLAQGTAR